MELLPSPEHQDMVRQRELLYDDTDGTTYRLVRVGWTPDERKLVGWLPF